MEWSPKQARANATASHMMQRRKNSFMAHSPNESFAAGEENSICGSLSLATTSDFQLVNNSQIAGGCLLSSQLRCNSGNFGISDRNDEARVSREALRRSARPPAQPAGFPHLSSIPLITT